MPPRIAVVTTNVLPRCPPTRRRSPIVPDVHGESERLRSLALVAAHHGGLLDLGPPDLDHHSTGAGGAVGNPGCDRSARSRRVPASSSAVSCADADHCWAVGVAGPATGTSTGAGSTATAATTTATASAPTVIAATANGGRTWVAQPLALPTDARRSTGDLVPPSQGCAWPSVRPARTPARQSS